MNMPSGWKAGTHEIIQDLNILALKSLLEPLLSVCVGFEYHPLEILMAQVMKSILNRKDIFRLYRFSAAFKGSGEYGPQYPTGAVTK